MIYPEHAKLIPVSGPSDQPDLENAVEVQFNPTSLRVSLSNTLRENERSGGTRAAQFVDKSSSTLTVTLIFDTTYVDAEQERIYRERAESEGRSLEAVEAGSDVRVLVGRIADRFIKPVGTGEELQAPSRCLFQWGAFEFIGMVKQYQETLDFFSPEGRPLRASLNLTLSEDRFQYRSREVDQAERQTPTLTPTGNGTDPSTPPGQGAPPLGSGGTGKAQRNWRETALFNGVETPRLPAAPALAIPKISLAAAVPGAAVKVRPPAFRFGASDALGTGIPGAFSTEKIPTPLTAPPAATVGRVARKAKDDVGFD